VSRNRCSSQCDCGYQLQLRNATTRPLSFEDYLKAITWDDCPYYTEYEDLIICQVQCPECGTLYAMWIGGSHWYDGRHAPYGCGLDTSYWYAFNDEPSARDRLSIPKTEGTL